MEYFEHVTNFRRNHFQLQRSQVRKTPKRQGLSGGVNFSSAQPGAGQGGPEADVRLPLQQWDVGSSVGAADLQKLLCLQVSSCFLLPHVHVIVWDGVETH